MYSKKIIAISSFLIMLIFSAPGAKSAEECFENVSRAVFKFTVYL